MSYTEGGSVHASLFYFLIYLSVVINVVSVVIKYYGFLIQPLDFKNMYSFAIRSELGLYNLFSA